LPPDFIFELPLDFTFELPLDFIFELPPALAGGMEKKNKNGFSQIIKNHLWPKANSIPPFSVPPAKAGGNSKSQSSVSFLDETLHFIFNFWLF